MPPLLDHAIPMADRAVAAIEKCMILDIEETLCVETVHAFKPANIFAGLVLLFAVSACRL